MADRRQPGPGSGAGEGTGAALRRAAPDFTERYARLADLSAANRFGLGVDAALWGPLAEYAAKRGVAAFPKFDAWLAEAAALARQHRFFHWELEFPEVFFDRHGQPLGEPRASTR